jgi:hypothetical protein
MSIQKKKYDMLVERIIKEELQRGELPTSNKVIFRINNYIREHDLSKPSLAVRQVRPGGLVSSSDYTNMLDEMYDDLSILYSMIINLHNTATTNLKRYEVERKRFDYELDKLEMQLNDLTQIFGDSGTMYTVYDNFTDLSKVGSTDADIDIAKREVTIKNRKTTVDRVAIPPGSSVSFQLFDGISDLPVRNISSNPSNILTMPANEVWKLEILSPHIQTIGGYLYVNFPNPIEATKIVLSLHSVKPTYVKMDYKPDGVNWIPVPYCEEESLVGSVKTYDFPQTTINNLRIRLAKQDYDGVSVVDGVEMYSYVLGVKELSFHALDYTNKSYLISSPLDAGGPIDKISLEVDADIVPGTKIDYWVAINDPDPIWYPISHISDTNPEYPQIIDFKNVEQAVPIIYNFPSDISITERELRSLSTNGIKFYQLGHIQTGNIIPGSERLYCGKDHWKLEAYPSNFPSDHTPTIADWNGVNTIPQYIKIDMNRPSEIIQDLANSDSTNYKISLFMYSDTQISNVFTPLCNHPTTIYLNGYKVYEAGENFGSLLLNKGWNELIILVHKYGEQNLTLNLNYDLSRVCSKFYSSNKPMTLVSLFDLQYNIPNTSRDKYCIANINGRDTIVLNHYYLDLDYEFHYNYSTSDTNIVLFKAELSRAEDNPSITPKLKTYRLRFS